MTEMRTIVGVLLDDSSSMRDVRVQTQSGLNEYMLGLRPQSDDERRISPIWVWGWKFSSGGHHAAVRPFLVARKIEEVGPMFDYYPQGNTPLYDAIGFAVKEMEDAKRSIGASKAILMIQTDGQENSSRTYTAQRARDLLNAKREEGWQIVFLGADLSNTYRTATDLGIEAVNTVSYNKIRTAQVFSASAENARAFASGRAASTAYSVAQRDASGDRPDWTP